MNINEIVRQISEEIYAQITGDEQLADNTPSAPASGASAMAKYIDHTLLKPEACIAEITRICEEAKKYQFASVCVNPSYIGHVAEQLQGSGVAPCCVIGFPLGACTPEAKGYETADAVANGAKEVDMVINIGAVKSGNWWLVKQDIESVVRAAHGKALVKVIIETCLLTDEEKVKACTVSKLAGANFVKTSTGFSTGGATVEDVHLMREAVGPTMGVKASGGVKNYQDAQRLIAAGANRLGTSSGKEIVTG